MPESSSRLAQWGHKFALELAPTHGRGLGALRTASAAVLATVLMLYLQLPVLAPGIYLIFLISYDVPYLTFRRTVDAILWQCVGFLLAIGLVIVTDNAPMARILGIAGFSFLSAFLLQTCRDPQIGINVGVFSVLTLTNWEMHRPPSQLVYLSFAPVLTGALSILCKIAIEYFFTKRDPHRALQLEIKSRLAAIAALFRALCLDTPQPELGKKINAVTRLAFAGQSKMAALVAELHSTQHRRKPQPGLPTTLVPLVAALLDQAASLARAGSAQLTGNWREELAEMARRTEALIALCPEPYRPTNTADDELPHPLAEMEQILEQMAALCRLDPIKQPEPTVALPPADPLFRPDTFSNSAYLLFAGKLSLSATICYVLYNAVGWPGISTACLTVLIAGLSSSGASNQKLVFRLFGALIGGVLFGIGCQIFVYPYAETLLPFLISVFVVSYIGAWIARGAHFAYMGMQIVFSFYLVAFQQSMMPRIRGGEFSPSALPVADFGAPLALTQGRDRIVGILIALLVMWAVFHQLRPMRSVERMRLRLAHLLRHESRQIAGLLTLDSATEAKMRDQAHAIVLEIRNLSEAISFEMDRHLEADRQQAARIEHAISHAGSLFLHLNALAHSEECSSLTPELFDQAAAQLTQIADLLDGSSSTTAAFEWSAPDEAPAALQSAVLTCRQLHHHCLELAAVID